MSKSIEESILDIFKDDPEIQKILKEKLVKTIDDIDTKRLTKGIEDIIKNAIDDDEYIYDSVVALSRKIIKEHIMIKLKAK